MRVGFIPARAGQPRRSIRFGVTMGSSPGVRGGSPWAGESTSAAAGSSPGVRGVIIGAIIA